MLSNLSIGTLIKLPTFYLSGNDFLKKGSVGMVVNNKHYVVYHVFINGKKIDILKDYVENHIDTIIL